MGPGWVRFTSAIRRKVGQISIGVDIKAAGMLRQWPTERAEYMHANHFNITNRGLQKASGPYMQDSRTNMPASCKSNNTVSASHAYCARPTGLFRADS